MKTVSPFSTCNQQLSIHSFYVTVRALSVSFPIFVVITFNVFFNLAIIMRVMQSVLIFWFFMCDFKLSFSLFICVLCPAQYIVYFRFEQKKKTTKKKQRTRTKKKYHLFQYRLWRHCNFTYSWWSTFAMHLFDATKTNGIMTLMKNCCLLIRTQMKYVHRQLCMCTGIFFRWMVGLHVQAIFFFIIV